MIHLTKPRDGERFVLNSDLIENIVQQRETHITLVDGRHYIVAESADDIIVAIQRFRAGIQSLVSTINQPDDTLEQSGTDRTLRVVTDSPKDGN